MDGTAAAGDGSAAQRAGSDLKNYARGDRHPKATVSDSDVVLMRYLHIAQGWGYKRLEKRFNCPIRTVRDILEGKTRLMLSPEEILFGEVREGLARVDAEIARVRMV